MDVSDVYSAMSMSAPSAEFQFKLLKLHAERSEPTDQLQLRLTALADATGIGDRLRHQIAIAAGDRRSLMPHPPASRCRCSRELRAVGLRGVMTGFSAGIFHALEGIAEHRALSYR